MPFVPAKVEAAKPPEGELPSAGARVEVLLEDKKKGTLFKGTVGEVVNGKKRTVTFDDGQTYDIDFAPDSMDVWRKEAEEEETEAAKKQALRAAVQEERQRGAVHALPQQLLAAQRARERRHAERLQSARALEGERARHARVLNVPAERPPGLALADGNVVIDPKGATLPLDAWDLLLAFGERRTRELAEELPPEDALEEEEDYLTDYFAFEVDERALFYAETGLVPLAGHADQTAVGMGRVRVTYDAFALLHAPPILVSPPTDGGLVGRRRAAEVRWSCGARACVVASPPEGEGAEAEGVEERAAPPPEGALRAGNLIVFPSPMPKPGVCATIGAPVELATGFDGWRTTVAFRPNRQAHTNPSLRACDRGQTARFVSYITRRDAAAVRRTQQMPAREWELLDQAGAEEDARVLSTVGVVHESTLELLARIREALAQPELHEADTATGGATITLGRRERVQRTDASASSHLADGVELFVLRLRAVMRELQARELTGAIAPHLGAGGADMAAVWPTVGAGLRNLLDADAYADGEADGREVCFPPCALQCDGGGGGADTLCEPLWGTQVAVRLTEVPAADAGEEEVLWCMEQPCGLHSDRQDVDAMEMIVYIHTASPPSGGQAGGDGLGLQLRLIGGAQRRRRRSRRLRQKSASSSR